MTRRVLFLCTGNSCRSQMAEGVVNHALGHAWTARSAGTRPGAVHPLAVRVMAEIGIDISSHRSKHLDELRGEPFDLVITLCDDAERSCPAWPGPARRVHIGFDDPAAAAGTPEEILSTFRRVRDDIRDRILRFLAAETAA